MIGSYKSFFILFIVALIGVLFQLQLLDTESALNAEFTTDRNYDYDRDGETSDASAVDDLVKVPQIILFLEASLVFLIILQNMVKRIRVFQPVIHLKGFILFILRPPAFL